MTYLEEDGLPMLALGAGMILRSGQRGISNHVRNNVGDLVYLVHDLVHVNAIVVRDLLVVAIPEKISGILGMVTATTHCLQSRSDFMARK